MYRLFPFIGALAGAYAAYTFTALAIEAHSIQLAFLYAVGVTFAAVCAFENARIGCNLLRGRQ